MSDRIPKVFHRIWLGGPLPEDVACWGRTWLDHNPGWELRTWTDADLPPLVNQPWFDAATGYAQRSDIARYEILEAHGGVYLDADFECLKPIDDLLEGLSFFACVQSGTTVGNGLFGCTPHHPILREAIRRVPPSMAGRSKLGVPEQTGPEFFTRVIDRVVRKGPPAAVGECRLFPPAYFFPYLHTEPWRAGESFPRAYGVHHWAGAQPRHEAATPDPAPEPAARPRLTPAIAAAAWRDRLAAERLRREAPARARLRRTVSRGAERLRGVAGTGPPMPAVYLGGGRLLVQTTWGPRLVVPSDDLSLTPHLAVTGEYEGNFAAYLMSRLRAGDTVVDVGANVGVFTTLMASLVGAGGRVYAYECNPVACAYLRDNLVLASCAGQVVALERAAGREPGELAFAAPRSMLGLGTTRTDLDVGPADLIQVTAERIDERIPAEVIVDLVKIDVEGAEVDVMAGMEVLFDERRVATVVLELGADRQAARWDEMVELLTDLARRRGARFAGLDGRGGLVPQSLDDVLTVGDYGNLVVDLPTGGGRP